MTEADRNINQKEYREKGGRESFLDWLRIAATCAVVLLHTITGVWDTTDMSGRPLELKVFLVAMDLITWCVPVFVLISGYLFLNPARKISFQQMLWKYCRRIVLALLVFGAPYACLELIATERTFRVGMVWESVLMVCRGQSWSHMWYLYMILPLYALTPLFKYLLGRCPGWLLYIVLGVLAVGSSILPYAKKLFGWENLMVLPDGGIYLFYYLCGYLFAAGPTGGRRLAGRWQSRLGHMRRVGSFGGCRIVRPGLKAVAAVLLAGMVVSRLVGVYSVQMAYNYPFTVAWSLIIFYLARGAGDENARFPGDAGAGRAALASKLGALSFPVYLIHPVFVNIAYKFLHITPLDFPIWLSLPAFFAVILGLSVPVAWALRKLPWMAGYVL